MRLVKDLDARHGAAAGSKVNGLHRESLGTGMPSSLMCKLNIKFHADVQRRRRRHGLRARILAVLSELRLLIQACGNGGDRTGRVFHYMEELNRFYLDLLRVHALPLRLRSALECTLDMRRIDSAAQTPTLSIVHEAPVSFTQREFRGIMTRYNADNTTCPLFDRDLYVSSRRLKPGDSASLSRSEPKRLGSIDPCQPSWIDYLVSDLTEAENHQLFGMVARSKVPQGTASMYRTAIEETLVFAFNRRGFLLDPIESMRVCAYFIRQAHCDQAKIEQLMPLWRCAGLWCTSMLREASDEVGDGEGQVVRAEAAAKELRFKRWNNVASGMISVLSQQCHEPAVVVAKVRCAWSLVSEWHRTWTAVMMALCPTERREFAAGIDKYAFPYWRPKLPGRFRLNELTLSTKSVNRLLVFLVRAGHVRDAVALLGFATSEAGVAIDCSLFNILLHGLVNPASVVAVHERDGRRFRLSSLSGLPLVNAHAPALYAASGSGEPPLGTSDDETLRTMQALLRGMVRWRLVPDSVTLDALVLFCCRTQNAALLDVVLRLFSGKWHTEPSESMLQKIREHGLGGVLAASPENKEH